MDQTFIQVSILLECLFYSFFAKESYRSIVAVLPRMFPLICLEYCWNSMTEKNLQNISVVTCIAIVHFYCNFDVVKATQLGVVCYLTHVSRLLNHPILIGGLGLIAKCFVLLQPEYQTKAAEQNGLCYLTHVSRGTRQLLMWICHGPWAFLVITHLHLGNPWTIISRIQTTSSSNFGVSHTHCNTLLNALDLSTLHQT